MSHKHNYQLARFTEGRLQPIGDWQDNYSGQAYIPAQATFMCECGAKKEVREKITNRTIDQPHLRRKDK